MESKHFSHPHDLRFHQLPQGAETSCAGCDFPASGPVYICWQCKFFLHEQCFLASRSMQHPLHPSHPLTLLPFPTYPSGSFTCKACSEAGTGLSFSCSLCDFDLHVSCAYASQNVALAQDEPDDDASDQSICPANDTGAPLSLALSVHHRSHPAHCLEFLYPPPYRGRKFTCDACGETGNDCTYHCDDCTFDLHVKCASLPEAATREDHEHPLKLHYSSVQFTDGSAVLMCDVCNRPVPKHLWVYYCSECDYGTHLNCVTAEKNSEGGSIESRLDDALLQLSELSKVQTNTKEKT